MGENGDRRKIQLPSPAVLVALLALTLGLAGTGYAAFKLGKNSVGTKQLKRNAVVSKKVKNGSLKAADFKRASLPEGPTGPAGQAGPRGPAGRSALEELGNGETVVGPVGYDDHATAGGQDFGGLVSYPIRGHNGPIAIYVDGQSPGETCTGTLAQPTAPTDTLCLYEESKTGSATLAAGIVGNRAHGFRLLLTSTQAGDILFYGSYAFTEGPA